MQLVINIENPWALLVGVIGNIVSFMVVMAPLSTMRTIFKKKSTQAFHATPYVVGLFSASLWLYYAVLNSDMLVLAVNSAACIIESIYLAIYLFYATKALKAFTLKMVLLLNVGIYGGLVFLTVTFLDGRRRVQIAGGICSAFAVSVFAAPLTVIKMVIKTKSVEYMPFSLSFSLTLSAIAWLCYGLILKDFFIALPNVVGLLFGITQMIVYFIYMNAGKGGGSGAGAATSNKASPAAAAAAAAAGEEVVGEQEMLQSVSITQPSAVKAIEHGSAKP